jgi:hypothetical protein
MTTWLIFVGACFGLSTCTYPAYALPVQPHVGLALVGYESKGTQPAPNAVFLCAESFGVRPSMVKLKGTRSRVPVSFCTGRPTLSALPPYLVVSGKASLLQKESDHD